ncbi:MAG: hypothetical protein HUJ80_00860, partial [Firmicutes bacterium]|nr:hypothetical protein [Bacillota bacterium]
MQKIDLQNLRPQREKQALGIAHSLAAISSEGLRYAKTESEKECMRVFLPRFIESTIAKWYPHVRTDEGRQECAEILKGSGIHVEKLKFYPEAIISLAAYPARILSVLATIKSLIAQDITFKKIVLQLTESEFPNRILPEDILRLQEFGLEIHWREKRIPAPGEHGDDIIVTADGGVIYPADWLRRLMTAYLEHPDCLNALRAHKIHFRKLSPKPCSQWRLNYRGEEGAERFDLFPVGAEGVAYTRKLLHPDAFRSDLFTKLRPAGDDIWLWAMALKNGTRIRLIQPDSGDLARAGGSRDGENPLREQNLRGANNDRMLESLLREYPEIKRKLRMGRALQMLREAVYCHRRASKE